MPEDVKPHAQGRFSAVLVLVVGLAATFFGVLREAELARRGRVIGWQDSFAQLQPVLEPLLSQRFEALRDLAKITLRRDKFSGSSWKEFLTAAEWRQRFPGMVEIGYAAFDGKKCTVKFLASSQSAPAHAPGYELTDNPTIREALQKSEEAGYGLPSREMSLGDGSNAVRVIIGLLALPIQDRRPGSAEENQMNLHGFVFFALNQPQYFSSIQPQLSKQPLDLKLLTADEPAPPRTGSQRPFSRSGVSGTWRLVATIRAPAARTNAPEWIVLAGGTALSLLMYSLFATQARLRLEAEAANAKILLRDAEITALNRNLEEIIAARTVELNVANERLARFAAVINATSDFVAIARLDLSALFLNQAGRRMVGLAEGDDLSHMRVSDFHPAWVNELFSRTAIPELMRTGTWSSEAALLHRDGNEIPVSIVGVILNSPDGQPEYLACIMRDISRRRQLEEELRSSLAEEKELNRLKSNLISMVTHEIRTPLALILGSSEILSRYLDRLAPDKRAEHLRTIESAVQRMSALLEDVLLFSKAEAGRMEFNPVAMQLKDFCTQLVDELASATNRRCPIELFVSTSSGVARADEGLLRHIFSNLITNAIKYSPSGMPVKFSVSRAGGDAVFVVQDGGMGIPEEDRKRLFTPFYRGKNVATIQGTGLGLMIVKHCVERHGGIIEIESAENLGTTASVRLPLFSPAHTEFIKLLSQANT